MKFSGHTLFNNTPVEIVLTGASVQNIREVASADNTTWIAPAVDRHSGKRLCRF